MSLETDIARLRMSKPGIIPVSVWNLLMDIIRSLQICASPDYNRKISPNGTTLEIKRGSGGAGVSSHPYQPYDASTSEAPMVGFASGNHLDGNEGDGDTWFPTVDGTPINTIPAPVLEVNPADTRLYFHGTVDSTTGLITAIEVLSGTSVPSNSSTEFYQLISTIVVTETDAGFSVQFLDDGVLGSQVYQKCGTNHLFGLQ